MSGMPEARFRERTDAAFYAPRMERIDSSVMDGVLSAEAAFDPDSYSACDVREAISKERLEPYDFGALLSPAAEGLTEEIARRARAITRDHFGNAVCMFTPLYASNFCESRCRYCGFNRDNDIVRARLTPEEVDVEMESIAGSGLTEILLLTGESDRHSDLEYIGMLVDKAAEHFASIGLEVYPMNSDDYRMMHERGADYVTIFQEMYDPVTYGRVHLGGRKRVFSYRFNAQERALMGGMRGVGFGALLGIREDWRKDAFSCGMHGYLLQRRYPWAEISYSLPRLRPCNGHGEDDTAVTERDLLQVATAYRLFMPFAGETVSTRELPRFRDGIVNICATKVSAGSSVRIGGHSDVEDQGDGQFELSDTRGVEEVRSALEAMGLQPVFNDYVRSDR